MPNIIFAPKWEELAGNWRKLYNEEHSQFAFFAECYRCEPTCEDEMGGALHVTVAVRNSCRIWFGNLNTRDNLGDEGLIL
jgi:hypothetical protein